MNDNWTQTEAIKLCTLIEEICPKFGCHVALTGGCLYKDGPRKDLDLVFYRIRQAPEIDINGLLDALDQACGIQVKTKHGWMFKAVAYKNGGKMVDIFFPETLEGDGYELNNS